MHWPVLKPPFDVINCTVSTRSNSLANVAAVGFRVNNAINSIVLGNVVGLWVSSVTGWIIVALCDKTVWLRLGSHSDLAAELFNAFSNLFLRRYSFIGSILC